VRPEIAARSVGREVFGGVKAVSFQAPRTDPDPEPQQPAGGPEFRPTDDTRGVILDAGPRCFALEPEPETTRSVGQLAPLRYKLTLNWTRVELAGCEGSAREKSMQRASRGWVFGSYLSLGVALGVTLGCQDKEKCNEALATSRKSMTDEFLDMALARQWRDHAGKLCGQGDELAALDKEIIEREAALAKAAEEKAEKEAEAGKAVLAQVKKLFQKWDKLEKDDEKNKKSLTKTKKKADKLVVGLAPAYAKQVSDYVKKSYAKRDKALKADK
jgi:hypothetical protein